MTGTIAYGVPCCAGSSGRNKDLAKIKQGRGQWQTRATYTYLPGVPLWMIQEKSLMWGGKRSKTVERNEL